MPQKGLGIPAGLINYILPSLLSVRLTLSIQRITR